MSTPYSVLFDSFSSKIEDPIYGNMTQLEAELDMVKLLNSAIIYFEYPKVNVFNKDDLNKIFAENLGIYEVEILALLMKTQWLKRQINSIYNIKQHMSDKDFRLTSQANHLNSLLELEKRTTEEINNVKIKYSYKNIDTNKPDFSGLSGDET